MVAKEEVMGILIDQIYESHYISNIENTKDFMTLYKSRHRDFAVVSLLLDDIKKVLGNTIELPNISIGYETAGRDYRCSNCDDLIRNHTHYLHVGSDYLYLDCAKDYLETLIKKKYSNEDFLTLLDRRVLFEKELDAYAFALSIF